MISLFESVRGNGIRRVVETLPSETAKLWICPSCRAKIYQGKITLEPQYKCLCGNNGWKVFR